MAQPVKATYINPASYALGSTPAQVMANGPAIIASHLSQMPAARMQKLDANTLVAVYTYSPQSVAIVQRISPASYNLMMSSVRAAIANGTLYSSSGRNHFVARGPQPPPPQGLAAIDPATMVYLDMIVGDPFDSPFGPTTDEEKRRAMVMTATFISETLDAADTGWLLGYDTAGPIIAYLCETYTPNLYAGIGSAIYNTVLRLAEYGNTLQQVYQMEGQLAGEFGFTSVDFYASSYDSMDALSAMD